MWWSSKYSLDLPHNKSHKWRLACDSQKSSSWWSRWHPAEGLGRFKENHLPETNKNILSFRIVGKMSFQLPLAWICFVWWFVYGFYHGIQKTIFHGRKCLGELFPQASNLRKSKLVGYVIVDIQWHVLEVLSCRKSAGGPWMPTWRITNT